VQKTPDRHSFTDCRKTDVSTCSRQDSGLVATHEEGCSGYEARLQSIRQLLERVLRQSWFKNRAPAPLPHKRLQLVRGRGMTHQALITCTSTPNAGDQFAGDFTLCTYAAWFVVSCKKPVEKIVFYPIDALAGS
jgi:hypothetical protein